LGIATKVLFHATSNQEQQAIKSIWHHADVRVLSNLPSIQQGDFEIIGNKKRKGFVSVGRISPVKNTHKLIELFSTLNYPLTIIGTHDDEEYFRKCSGMINDKSLIKIIPGLAPDALAHEIMAYRFFVSMTSGENFGHAIIEAMSMGCPVLISDTTPWNDIPSAKAGWVITLSQQSTWLACLKEAHELDDDMYNVYSANARNYVKAKFDHVQIKNAYLNLFND
jgi:glycosyltransferase involved in cell wall biosynthesis